MSSQFEGDNAYVRHPIPLIKISSAKNCFKSY